MENDKVQASRDLPGGRVSEERKDVPKQKVYICRFKGDRNLLISISFLQIIYIIYNYRYIYIYLHDYQTFFLLTSDIHFGRKDPGSHLLTNWQVDAWMSRVPGPGSMVMGWLDQWVSYFTDPYKWGMNWGDSPLIRSPLILTSWDIQVVFGIQKRGLLGEVDDPTLKLYSKN